MGKHQHIQPATVPERVTLEPRIIAYVGSRTLCEMLDISESTLWEWVRKGHLPRPVKIGVSSRWKWAEVEKRIAPEDQGDDDPILRASRGG
ncbi:hypothetical protein pben1_p03 [Paracoccus phage vB_PbeS_Pben1]|uniref:CP4-57 regulatory protein AlpA n=1 Tax=Paracoccus versutus TaxID=34007 RepID=A0A3D9XPA7_PARVE|nr:helix-turn-helix domain-containing protein [Paracoccus versutus]AZV00160.1 hypothetical protein pben1_p03 [Paracoccus phage vB_PbeS_Pben1]REF72277.1 CP4-57 regulatory protein AlpA [Paracoccus versutus]WGR55738.1 AlpA family phage regulatory protein [Paracoccus versutus]SFY20349.1 Prophage CP4-57 regulatory protein (AlpA) [Paracoccus pantotrophus]